MDGAALPLVAIAIGGVGIVAGAVLVRGSGADTRAGRRLAGAKAVGLRDLEQLAARDELPRSAVRVNGRVRCADPLLSPSGDRLAALHRDVELQLPDGGWRIVQRTREARAIDLWERSATVPLDLSQVAEPLITIPQVWEGPMEHLGPAHQPAIDRVTRDLGTPRAARVTTRQVQLVDQLLMLAVPRRDASGRLRLDPPPGGYLVATVDLDVAMRLLAGPRRTRMLAGFGVIAAGLLAVASGAVALLVGAVG